MVLGSAQAQSYLHQPTYGTHRRHTKSGSVLLHRVIQYLCDNRTNHSRNTANARMYCQHTCDKMTHDLSTTKITASFRLPLMLIPPPLHPHSTHPSPSYSNLSLHHFQLYGGGCAGTVFTIEIIFYSCGSFNKGVLKWFHLVGYC